MKLICIIYLLVNITLLSANIDFIDNYSKVTMLRNLLMDKTPQVTALCITASFLALELFAWNIVRCAQMYLYDRYDEEKLLRFERSVNLLTINEIDEDSLSKKHSV